MYHIYIISDEKIKIEKKKRELQIHCVRERVEKMMKILSKLTVASSSREKKRGKKRRKQVFSSMSYCTVVELRKHLGGWEKRLVESIFLSNLFIDSRINRRKKRRKKDRLSRTRTRGVKRVNRVNSIISARLHRFRSPERKIFQFSEELTSRRK